MCFPDHKLSFSYRYCLQRKQSLNQSLRTLDDHSRVIFFSPSYIIFYYNFNFRLNRAKHFKLNEIRRILEIMSTNRVEDEIEVLTLSRLLLQANITSNDHKYEKLMDTVSIDLSPCIIQRYTVWLFVTSYRRIVPT